MARPRTYTDRMNKALCDDIIGLFGKPRNAYDKLCLGETGLTFGRFSSLIRWGPCFSEERDIVESRWVEWCHGYLRSPFGYDDLFWKPSFERVVLAPGDKEWKRRSKDIPDDHVA